MANTYPGKKQSIWRNTSARREALTAYMFLSPYLLTTLVFTIGVFAFAIYISFTDYNLFTTPEWVGLEHYKSVLGDQKFLRSLINTLYYALIVVSFQTTFALLLAVLLNAPMRAKQFFRTIFYAPAVTSSVVISFIFLWLYLKTGYVNHFFSQVLGLFGAEWTQINWLNDPRGLFQLILGPFGVDIPSEQWYLRGPSITWMAIMFQNIFTTVPTFMIMFLAALQDIPPSLYEAAAIDGANGRQRFFNITVPMLRPVIFLIVVLGTIGTWQIFDQVKLLTSGGPLNTTLTPVYLIFSEGLGISGPPRMGYAASRAFMLGAIIFIFTIIQRRYIERGTEQY
ncbi:MAG: sugar ABC transporter permease [Candidatus Promineifilaceae bacterium]